MSRPEPGFHTDPVETCAACAADPRITPADHAGILELAAYLHAEGERMSRLAAVMLTPRGYVGVEHDDGTVHAIDLDTLHDDRPLWREPPVCGRATGVSSDEGGRAALHRRAITCLDCVSILA
jgi:hypothetical protein